MPKDAAPGEYLYDVDVAMRGMPLIAFEEDADEGLHDTLIKQRAVEALYSRICAHAKEATARNVHGAFSLPVVDARTLAPTEGH